MARGPEGGHYENIHVGWCDRAWKGQPAIEPGNRPWGVVGLTRGDAKQARWEVEVVLKDVDGGMDFGGPGVRGGREDRHIALAWGEMPDEQTFVMFRGAKLRLDTIEPTVVREAAEPGQCLVGRLGLTDEPGYPRCASVRPPAIVWTAELA